MPPSLVIASNPYTAYPGGIIALRCVDYMGAARGTLTSEAATTSVCGTVVRDAQTVATSIFTNAQTAYAAADDSVVFDIADLPYEEDFIYHMLLSYLIEGDWDITNSDTLEGGTQELFAAALDIRFHGANVTEASSVGVTHKYRALSGYRIVSFGSVFGPVDGDETITIRAYAQAGTTIEVLLDQIYLIPDPTLTAGEWTTSDFAIIGGQANLIGYYDLTDGSYVDGGDGGDDNGKFTWHPIIAETPTIISGADGGGDYQKTDAEYMARIVGDDGAGDGDFYFLENSTKAFPNNETTAHCYGLHGPWFTPAQDWVDDDFSRTLYDGNFAGADNHFAGSHWGDTPEGFSWAVRAGASGPSTDGFGRRVGTAVWVDGSQGKVHIRRALQSDDKNIDIALWPLTGGSPTAVNNTGARIRADNLEHRGKFSLEQTILASGGGPLAYMGISTYPAVIGLTTSQPITLHFDFIDREWSITGPDGTTIDGPTALAWWTGTQFVGWRLRIDRYRLRVRVWEDSGGEPGTWDYDDFRPLRKLVGGQRDYSYQSGGIDDLNYSVLAWDEHTFGFNIREVDVSTIGNPETHPGTILTFDNIFVTHDPNGTQASAYASIERPEGNEVGQIEMPDCQHLVYWGARDWTDYITGDGPYIGFSAKTWNDAGAADLQRSEAVWWWFRSIHHPYLVPMNWRSSTREGGWKRVLKGDT